MKYDLTDHSVVFMGSFARVTFQREASNREKYNVILSADEVKNLAPNGENEFMYGEYPQKLVDEDTRMTLEKAFSQRRNPNAEMQETGKEYTIMYPKTEYKKYKEYMFGGRKYVRVIPLTDMILKLTPLKAKVPTWCEVNPIKWVREKDDSFRMEISLFSGRMKDDTHPNYVSEDDWQPKFNEWFNEKFAKEILTWGMVAVNSLENSSQKRKRRGYGVTIDRTPMSVTEQIDFYVKTRKNFLLQGPSGCGKTERIRDIDPDLVAIPLAKGCMAEDIVGRVVYSDGGTCDVVDKDCNFVELPKGGTWYAPAWYKDICKKCIEEPDKTHVLFIDEIFNVSENQQALLLHLLGDGRSITPSDGVLPDNVVIVLAGNRVQDSNAAYNPTEPMWRRQAAIIDIEPNVADWLEWGSHPAKGYPPEEGRLKVHPLVAAFVATYGEKCFYTKFDEQNPTRVMDPRGWVQISDIIYNNKGVIRHQMLINKMGQNMAENFLNFASEPHITIEDILADDLEDLAFPQRPDEKLALVYGLRYASERDVSKVRAFVHRHLGREMRATFDKMWCDGKPERALFLKRLDDRMHSGGGR